MRNALKMWPLMLFPYVYMIVFINFILSEDIMDILPDSFGNFFIEYALLLFILIAIVSNLWALILAIVSSVKAAKGKISVKDAAFANMLVKLVQIPAYIINFILGIFSMLLSLWGIGLLLWVIIADIVSICYTGINAIGACVACSKNKVFPKGLAVLFGFLNFIYCVDVVVAIVMYVKAKVADKKNAAIA